MSDEILEGWMKVYPVMNICKKNKEYAFQNVVQPKYLPSYKVGFSEEEWNEFKEEKNPETEYSLTSRLCNEFGFNLLINPSIDIRKDKETEYKESLFSEIRELKNQLEVEKERFSQKLKMFIENYVKDEGESI